MILARALGSLDDFLDRGQGLAVRNVGLVRGPARVRWGDHAVYVGGLGRRRRRVVVVRVGRAVIGLIRVAGVHESCGCHGWGVRIWAIRFSSMWTELIRLAKRWNPAGVREGQGVSPGRVR